MYFEILLIGKFKGIDKYSKLYMLRHKLSIAFLLKYNDELHDVSINQKQYYFCPSYLIQF